jgi:hypothetical protein
LDKISSPHFFCGSDESVGFSALPVIVSCSPLTIKNRSATHKATGARVRKKKKRKQAARKKKKNTPHTRVHQKKHFFLSLRTFAYLTHLLGNRVLFVYFFYPP